MLKWVHLCFLYPNDCMAFLATYLVLLKRKFIFYGLSVYHCAVYIWHFKNIITTSKKYWGRNQPSRYTSAPLPRLNIFDPMRRVVRSLIGLRDKVWCINERR